MPKVKHRMLFKCPRCGKEYMLGDKVYHRKIANNELCVSCNASDQMKKSWASVSKEEKDIKIARMRNGYDHMSDEIKSKLAKSRSVSAKNQWKTMSPEAKAKFAKKSSESHKRWWANIDEELFEKISQQRSEQYVKWWNSLTDDQKRQWAETSSKNSIRQWNMMTDDVLNHRSEKLSKSLKEYNSSLTDSEKAEISKRLRDVWKNKSKEELDAYREKQRQLYFGGGYKKIREGYDRWWNGMTDVDRQNLMRKILTRNTKRSGLNTRFEQEFNLPGYRIMEEYPTTNNGVTHCWDYGIFDENGELVMVVDLDGAYFHADICDYDGMHSILKYDKRRGLAIPNDTLHCIIRELYFDEDFEWMTHIIKKSFDEYVAEESGLLASMPFPHPKYDTIDLVRSWNNLCSSKYTYPPDNRFGDRIIQHFSNSLYDEKIWKGDWIRTAVSNHTIYHYHSHKNKILLPIIQDYISAYRVKSIISDITKFDKIYDPYTNPSIMLGAIAAGKQYVTSPIDECHYNDIMNIAEFLESIGVQNNIHISNNDDGCYNIKEVVNENQIF